jgi:hypothetical protein
MREARRHEYDYTADSLRREERAVNESEMMPEEPEKEIREPEFETVERDEVNPAPGHNAN